MIYNLGIHTKILHVFYYSATTTTITYIKYLVQKIIVINHDSDISL
jgi:hypothetical protein